LKTFIVPVIKFTVLSLSVLIVLTLSTSQPDQRLDASGWITARLAAGAQVSNPAGAYCSQALGYQYEIITHPDGSQDGYCVLTNQTRCEQWDFYAGRCGAAYSVCSRNGLETVTRQDGQDPYSPAYSQCVDRKSGKAVATALQLTGLDQKSGLKEEVLTLPSGGSSTVRPNAMPLPASVPSSFDWRTKDNANWLSSVKNQASCGSCWAFASVSVAEAAIKIRSNNPGMNPDLSEQDVLSCSGSGTCNGGDSSGALTFVADNGIVDEACHPYTTNDAACSSGRCADWQSHLNHVGNVVGTWFPSSAEIIKQQVLANGPAVVYLGVGSSFGGNFDANGVYRCSNDSQNNYYSINHAVTLTGWDDAEQVWILKNSWGTYWNSSMGGYFKLGYGECNVERFLVLNIQREVADLPNHIFVPVVLR
jgi:C1A family cysteine protease/putative hemolysin